MSLMNINNFTEHRYKMTVIEKDQNKTILQSCLSTDKTRMLCNNKRTAISLSQQTRVVAEFSPVTAAY